MKQAATKLSLWDEQINIVTQGNKISVENGYTQAFHGENSLNIGKYGKLTNESLVSCMFL